MCLLYFVYIAIVSGGPLTVNVSVLLLSLASPDESSLVSTNNSVFSFSVKSHHSCNLNAAT